MQNIYLKRNKTKLELNLFLAYHETDRFFFFLEKNNARNSRKKRVNF